MSLTLPSPLQSLAMLKDGFRTDRGSHSDLWSSSSSLESSGFPLPKQYLDVSSQTDISGSVSMQCALLGASLGEAAVMGGHLLLTHLRRGLVALWGWLLTQPSGAPSSPSPPGPSVTVDKPALTPCPQGCLAMCLCL